MRLIHSSTKRLCLVAAFVIWAALAFSGCRKEQPDEEIENGMLELKFIPTIGGEPFVLSENYELSDGRPFAVDLLQFYVSNVRLVKDDGEELPLEGVSLLKAPEPGLRVSHGAGATVEFSAPPGQYKGLRFDVGLDSTLNHGDPSIWPDDHPLSIYQGTHWRWATGYRFVMAEGVVDTSAAKDRLPAAPFAFHTGTTPLTRSFDFTDRPEYAQYIAPNNYAHFNLRLDVRKLFDGGPHRIDLAKERITHTLGDNEYDLAVRFTENFKAAFTADNSLED